ncbi:hypothetical protein [Pedobacter metabolipauper]|uniref:Uncharacterized protein n=1 Tax=Pedobacter metabolipauper TaxID=425513 RepID=A0A4R6ST41_9SPHI|nr:hypothetical protein [Pedobacter metabolipauper]TDQ06674.1 hypothetical protein ATK78_4333 [Pedobacter metabolipauper]
MRRYLNRTLLFCALLLTVSKTSYAQKLRRSDTISIHNLVVDRLKIHKNQITINLQTDRSDYLRYFDFKDLNTVGGDTKRFLEQKEWRTFLSNVDTSKIADYKLETKGKRWFKDIEGILPAERLIFSPVIFSKESNKAIVMFTLLSFSGSNLSGSKTAWFYENLKGKWLLKTGQVIVYID